MTHCHSLQVISIHNRAHVELYLSKVSLEQTLQVQIRQSPAITVQ